MFRRVVLIAVSIFSVTGWLCAQQPESDSRPAKLESNRQYIELLEQDKALQIRQDSIVGAMENLRVLLRTNPELRDRISTEILWLENRIFEIRSEKGRLVDRINALEQRVGFGSTGKCRYFG